MKRILKYELNDNSTILSLPENTQVLHVGYQDKKWYIWVLVQLDSPVVSRTIWILPTGSISDETFHKNHDHIGTFQEDPFVWHVFMEVQT